MLCWVSVFEVVMVGHRSLGSDCTMVSSIPWYQPPTHHSGLTPPSAKVKKPPDRYQGAMGFRRAAGASSDGGQWTPFTGGLRGEGSAADIICRRPPRSGAPRLCILQ